MTKKLGAIPALIVFIIGILLALPDEANMGIMIIERFQTNYDVDNPTYKIYQNSKLGLRILGFALIMADIGYVILQFKKGNYF